METGALFLNIENRSTDTGTYVIEAEATLGLAGAERTFTPDASITGPGTLRLTAGSNGYAFSGTFRPGDGVGIMAVGSDWPAFDPDGVFEMEAAGLAPGTEHDHLAVSGAATLGGILRVVPADGFALTEGDRFTMVHELGHNMGRRHSPCGGAAGASGICAPRRARRGLAPV